MASEKRLAPFPVVPSSPQTTLSGSFGESCRVRSLEKSFGRAPVLNPELFVDPSQTSVGFVRQLVSGSFRSVTRIRSAPCLGFVQRSADRHIRDSGALDSPRGNPPIVIIDRPFLDVFRIGSDIADLASWSSENRVRFAHGSSWESRAVG